MATEKKKKLLVTASTFPRWKGDTEPRFVLDLAAHMTEEFDVTVLVPAAPGAADREILDGVNIVRYHYFPVHKWEILCYPGAIIPRIREKKIRVILVPFLLFSLWWNLHKMLPDFELIHAHWLIPQGVIQSFFRKPYVVTGHGGDVTSLNNNILKKLKMRCLRKAGRVTVVAGHLKEKVQEAVPEITPDIIPMGVVCSAFGKEFYVQNYFGQKERKVVLFVGRLAEKKGVKYLIEAMPSIVNRIADTKLLIVGDFTNSESKKQYEEMIAQMKVKDCIDIYDGYIPDKEVEKFFVASDLVVLPYISATQSGIAQIAYGFGKPVVATNVGGLPDIVSDRKTGYIIESENKDMIRDAVTDFFEQNRAEMFAEGVKKEAYRFSWEKMVDNITNILEELQ